MYNKFTHFVQQCKIFYFLFFFAKSNIFLLWKSVFFFFERMKISIDVQSIHICWKKALLMASWAFISIWTSSKVTIMPTASNWYYIFVRFSACSTYVSLTCWLGNESWASSCVCVFFFSEISSCVFLDCLLYPI